MKVNLCIIKEEDFCNDEKGFISKLDEKTNCYLVPTNIDEAGIKSVNEIIELGEENGCTECKVYLTPQLDRIAAVAYGEPK